jgi:hypothetical protein
VSAVIDVTIRFSRVAASRRHAAEKPGGSVAVAEDGKHDDLVKASAAAAAAAGTPVPTSSWDLQPLSFDQYAAPGESALVFFEMLSGRMAERAYCSPGAAGRRLFRSSATAYALTKLLLFWHDTRRHFRVGRLL